MMMKATIIGASGYSGSELVKLLTGHSDVLISSITSTRLAGQPITALYPNLLGATDLKFEELDAAKAAASDVVFLALPHGRAMEIVPKLKGAGGAKIIDLSGDLRLPGDVYEAWYKKPHSAPELADEAVYGLSEINGAAIANAGLIANPGCFPTGMTLAVAPLIAAGAIDSTITATALTGISGAGRGACEANNFCLADENIAAYKTGGAHQHIPEMEAALGAIAAPGETAADIRVSFTPVLAPISRGIYSIVTAVPAIDADEAAFLDIFRDYYRSAPFVHILEAGATPRVKAVAGSNYCHIGLALDARLNRLTVFSAIDNLVKGAAGQAVQNMNIMFGLDETTGLKAAGLYP